MQGLSLEHLDNSQPFPTTTPEGSPQQSEVAVVTTPQVESTDSLEPFRITNTREDYRIRRGERPFVRLNSSEEAIVTSSESSIGIFLGKKAKILFGQQTSAGPSLVLSRLSSPKSTPRCFLR